METIYLDWAATSPMEPDMASQMAKMYIHTFGNPSSAHSVGRASREILETSRKLCSSLLKVEAEQLVFTSGGTEANTIPLLSLLRRTSTGEIILSSIEHAAVYEIGSLFRYLGYQVKEVKPDADGIIRPEAVRKKLSPKTIAVAVMLVNNEIGSIQPIQKIAREVRNFENENSCRIHFHCDAVQALGKIPVYPGDLGADSLAFSGHKFRGPKGTGLLYTRDRITPLSSGGGQEFSIRPGTENVPGIWAFSESLEKRNHQMENEYSHACELRDMVWEQVKDIEGVEFFPAQRGSLHTVSELSYSPYIIALSVAPVPGEVCARVLNDRGIAVGTGSACSSNRERKRGRVIYSITSDEKIARGIIRISFGPTTAKSDIDAFLHILKQEIKLLRKTVLHRRF